MNLSQVTQSGCPSLPTQAELVGPVSLPWPSLPVPNRPPTHLTLPMGSSFPLLNPCTLRAPKDLLHAQPNCLWPTSLSLYKDTVWPPAQHVGWPHHHVSSPSRVSSSLPRGQRGEVVPLRGTSIFCEEGWRDGPPEILLHWPDLGVCLGLLQGAERQLCAFFGTAHSSGQASPLCYGSCDADRDEALSPSSGCVRLCTPQPAGQLAIICIMGPIVRLQGWIKCPVCVHVCTRVQRTPLGHPEPGCHSWHCALASLPWHIEVTVPTKATPSLRCFRVR